MQSCKQLFWLYHEISLVNFVFPSFICLMVIIHVVVIIFVDSCIEVEVPGS